MSTVEVLMYGDPRNWKNVEDWINTLDYGSRAYNREWRAYSISMQKQNIPLLLADLKHHYKGGIIGMPRKSRFMIKIMKFFLKLFGIQKIDMDKIEKTPDKWFKDFKKQKHICHSVYMFPIAILPDSLDKTDKTGLREEI